MKLNAWEVYKGSDGDVTKAFYAELTERGPIGLVAVNLFRAHKCSSRAKVYRGGIRGKGSFKGMAYDRKNWSMENLCKILGEEAGNLSIRFGWKEDPEAEGPYRWVLYVDLPTGQASFHCATRFAGPDYRGEFDGMHQSAERIIAFCESVRRQPAVVGAGSIPAGHKPQPAREPESIVPDWLHERMKES